MARPERFEMLILGSGNGPQAPGAGDMARAGAKDRRRGTPARRASCPNVADEVSRARCLRPIAAAEDRCLEPFASSHSVASGAGFWREPIGDCNVARNPHRT